MAGGGVLAVDGDDESLRERGSYHFPKFRAYTVRGRDNSSKLRWVSKLVNVTLLFMKTFLLRTIIWLNMFHFILVLSIWFIKKEIIKATQGGT